MTPARPPRQIRIRVLMLAEPTSNPPIRPEQDPEVQKFPLFDPEGQKNRVSSTDPVKTQTLYWLVR